MTFNEMACTVGVFIVRERQITGTAEAAEATVATRRLKCSRAKLTVKSLKYYRTFTTKSLKNNYFSRERNEILIPKWMSEIYEYSGLRIRRERELRAVQLKAKGAGLIALAPAFSCSKLAFLHDIELILILVRRSSS